MATDQKNEVEDVENPFEEEHATAVVVRALHVHSRHSTVATSHSRLILSQLYGKKTLENMSTTAADMCSKTTDQRSNCNSQTMFSTSLRGRRNCGRLS